MVITTLNPSTDGLEKSYLSNPYSTSTTTIQVKNSDRFAINDRIMVGEMGLEATEVVTVSGVNADQQTLTIGATLFSHEADAPVYRLRYDQVRIYRSTTGASGAYSVLATTNLDVDNADLSTIYDDTSGLSTYYYKTSVYNSISTVESSLTDPIQGSGYRRSQFGYLIDEILREVNDPQEQHISRIEMLGYFNDVNDDLLLNVSRPYDFLRARTTLDRTAGNNYVNFPVDSNGDQIMWKFDRMDYNYQDPTTSPLTNITYTLRVLPEEEFRNTFQDNTTDITTEDDKVQDITLDTALQRFRYSPPSLTTQSGAFYLYYWAYFNRISTEGQEIQTPTAKIYKLYAKWRYYDKRAAAELSYKTLVQDFQQQYQREINNYTKVNRRDKGTPRGFRPASNTVRDYRR